MLRTIACSLALALLCSAAFAEERKQQAQQQQEDQSAAGAQDQASQEAAADEAQPAAAREQGQQGEQDPTKLFVQDAYSTNLYEVQLGQWVAQRAQDDQIKQFARMLVQDHTKANQQLKQIAQSAQIQVREQLDPVHQAKLQKMQKCPASAIDRKFINGQVGGHMISVLEFRYQSQNAQNQQIKQYATQTLPKLEQHLEQATDIAQKLAGGEARTAGERQTDRQSEQPGAQPQQDQPGAEDQPAQTDQPGAAAEEPSRQQSE